MMAYTDAVPTIAEIYQARKGIYDVTKFTFDPGLTFVDSDNKTKLTLNGLINDIGFINAGTFAAGVTITRKSELVMDAAGLLWQWQGTLPRIVTAGTVPSTPTWVQLVTTSVQSLTGLTQPSGLDAIYARNVNSIKSMGFTPTLDGHTVTPRGFYAGTTVGGGDFIWDSSKDKALHNGGTIIAPEAIDAWDGTNSGLTTLLNWTGAGSGCWVKVETFGVARPEYWGATVDNTGNSTPSFQAAEDSPMPIQLTPGHKYKLLTPVFIKSGSVIQGTPFRNYSESKKAVIYPTTVAFRPSVANETVQQDGFTLENVMIRGGTYQVDLGLFHNVSIKGVISVDPVNAFVSLVRGERHVFENLAIWAQTVSSEQMFAFSNKNKTTMAAITAMSFGVDGEFCDRITMTDITAVKGVTTRVVDFITSGSTNNNSLTNVLAETIILHGLSGAFIKSNGKLLWSNFINVLSDSGTSTGKFIDVTKMEDCTFIDVDSATSGNNSYSVGVDCFMEKVTFINSYLKGAGWQLPSGVGQRLTLINCQGTLSHVGSNVLQRARTNVIGGQITSPDSEIGSFVSENMSRVNLFMADTNGTLASTAKDVWRHSRGGGQSRDTFEISLELLKMHDSTRFDTGRGGVILSSLASPEGVLAAPVSSICMVNSATPAIGGVWVKDTGTGNTGWVKK